MNGGPAEIRAIPVFQGSHQLGEIQLLIDLDQKMVGINESRSRLLVNWKKVESLRQRSSG